MLDDLLITMGVFTLGMAVLSIGVVPFALWVDKKGWNPFNTEEG